MNTQSAGYKLFHYFYPCRVEAMHLVTPLELEVFGMVTTGNAQMDRQMAHELVDVQLNIATMAEYLDEGVVVTLLDPADSAKIYPIIVEHLQDWERVVTTQIHHPEVPTEDLQKLDRLATEILSVAKLFIREPVQQTGFFRTTSRKGLQRFGRGDETAAPTVNTTNPFAQATHTPIADALARASFSRGSG